MGEPDPDAVDYYSRIGVSQDADIETIERRRKQADRRFSPMSSSPEADEQRHMQINAASNVLEDPDSRERYDTFYEAFGPVEGTAVYETLAGGVAAAVVADERLLEHLRGFVEVVGPVDGARAFGAYYEQLDPPPAFEDLDLPEGYEVADTGFGVAAWSFRAAGEPCSFRLWLTGGRDLWRRALEEPDDVPAILETLEGSREEVADRPTTRLEDTGEGRSVRDLPREYLPGESEDGTRWPSVGFGTPTRRVWRTLAYLGRTALWATVSTGAAGASGTVSLVAAVVVFMPLVALGLVVRSWVPGVDAAVQSAVGVPLADPDAPFGAISLGHYLTVCTLVGVAMGLSGWVFVAIHDRRERGLPRDAWLVFALALAALAATLFGGVGAGWLPRSAAVAATGLVTAVTFQAAMDVRAPWLLAQLCRSVAAIAVALAGAVAALVAAEGVLSAVAPGTVPTYAALLARLPLIEPPAATLDNAEIAAVGFAALALVPLAMTTLYSLAYALESVAIRWRSDPQRS